MTMSKHEIERALIELRLSGMAATLDTRVLQAHGKKLNTLEVVKVRKSVKRDFLRVR